MARRKPKRGSAPPSINQTPLDFNSESVVKRLDRIADNYRLLDDILCDLESSVLSQCDEVFGGATDPKKPR